MVMLTELENTLFGLVLKAGPENKTEFKAERPVHIAMAALDTKTPSDNFVRVMVSSGSESNKFLLCTLNKDKLMQQPINIELNAGETVTFFIDGPKGSVHLTGMYISEHAGQDHGPGNENFSQKDMEEYLKQVNADYFKDEDDDSDDDSDDDDDEDDDEDDEDDDDDAEGMDGSDVETISEDDDDDEDDEDDDDDEDDSEDEEESAPANGNKRKLEVIETKKDKKTQEKVPKLVPAKQEEKKFQLKTIQGGVTIKDIKEGTGPVAKKGKFVSVYYAGKLKSNGKQFDKCIGGKPFKFRLGSGEVIKGWDVGFENMKVGGKRTIVVPPNMGYGKQRMGNDIPANSTLVFDVELKAVS